MGRAAMLVAAIASAVTGAPSLAAQAATSEASAQGVAAERWAVHGGEQYCVLSRVRLAPAANLFSLRMVPGTDRPELIVPAGDWSRAGRGEEDKGNIAFEPGGVGFEVRLTHGRVGGDRVAVLQMLPAEFMDALRGARRIAVGRGGRQGPDMAFPDPGQALSTFDQCLAQGMSRWGVDAQAYAALRRRPRLVNHDWLRAIVTPRGLGFGERHVIARHAIDASGRVTECTIVDGSGSEAFDEATCAAALEHARYEPAIDSEGRPTAAEIIDSTILVMSLERL